MGYLEVLNKEQYQAVTTNSKYVRVNAGAGSGKTRVLASRIAYLIEEYGLSEQSILAITFTNKVAKEMKTRIVKMLNREDCQVRIFTYHSFCVRFLRKEVRNLNNQYSASFTIYDDEDQESIIKKILKDYNVDKEQLTVKQMLNYISNKKNQMITPKQALESLNGYTEEEIKAKVYEDYEKELYKAMAFDFDDLIIKTVQILKEKPHVRTFWQRSLSHILVDEFQDTNDIQYLLLKLLTGEDTNVFVVGDPDQTIYTWRGANVRLIINFDKDYKSCEDIILNRNYRSSANILKSANTLIKNNLSRLPKELIANKENGDKVMHYQAPNEEYEAIWVIEKIKQLKAEDPNLNYSDFAILYRSNYYTRNFEQILIRYKIPYCIFGGMRFFQRKEIKDALSYLRLAINENDDQAFLRIINEPKRGIGDKTLKEIYTLKDSDNTSLYKVIKNSDDNFIKKETFKKFVELIEEVKLLIANKEILFADIMYRLLQRSNYLQMLIDNKEDERLDNIKELQAYLMDMQKDFPDKSLEEILQEIPVLSAQDEITEGDYLSLMTVHTAKGLEFLYVFIIGMSEGIFPNARSVGESESGLEEERRLCYVAITRAMKGLFLLDCRGFDYISNSIKETSRFIYELDDSLRETKRKEATNNIPRTTLKEYYAKDTGNNIYRPGMLVEHVNFGPGIIIALEGNAVRVTFKNTQYGTKLIATNFKGLKVISGGNYE